MWRFNADKHEEATRKLPEMKSYFDLTPVFELLFEVAGHFWRRRK